MNNRGSLPGRAYFITLCAYQSRSLLAKLINSQVELTEAGRIASMCWSSIPEHMPEVHLDANIVMPSHFHAILMIDDRRQQTADSRQLNAAHRSLATVIRSFKSAATRRVNHQNGTPGASLWQPSYHARVIKTQPALEAFRQYIRDNPASWQSDPLNPDGDRPAPFCPVPLNRTDGA